MARELDDLREQYDKQRSLTVSQQRELDDLMSSKDDVGKNVIIQILYLKHLIIMTHFFYDFGQVLCIIFICILQYRLRKIYRNFCEEN